VWHEFRASLLVAAIALSVLARFIFHRRFRRQRISLSPLVTAPDLQSSGKDAAGLWEQNSVPEILLDGNISELNNTDINSVPKGPESDSKRQRLFPKRVRGSKVERKADNEKGTRRVVKPLIFYFSLTESFTKDYAAKKLRGSIIAQKEQHSTILDPKIYDIAVLDYVDFFEHAPTPEKKDDQIQYFYVLLLPSYNIDTALDLFLNLLRETHHDFRIDTAPLASIAGYSIFGFGDRAGWPTEEDGFCSQAIEADKWMAKLTGGKRAFPIGLGDVKSDVATRFEEWSDGVLKSLVDFATHGSLGEGAPGSGEHAESDEEDVEQDLASTRIKKPGKWTKQQHKPRVDDLEDLGGKSSSQEIASRQLSSPSSLPIDFTTTGSTFAISPTPQAPKEMVPVTSPTHAALTKQGYTIIGSHSGVKICRWTKSALRGRGSCYKYSFYGIASHLCMETTPSLSCSNKCVFCWRHGTNPVGVTWRWQVDPPELIFNGAKEGHYKKIKMMRGVPGVRAERFQEAMRIRHCALSLVGEPIFYPHINAFVALLHKERISSFLVCNAQHPDQLAALEPVTQLYVSIDASNAESLRKIDRPLHRDYWQRFLRCLDILREKRNSMRTVYRLTLVKGFNIESEVEGYADLVARGLPCFVEIKGVTYCGTSTSAGAGLTMGNVPFYNEIVEFVETLNTALERRGLDYGIAAEHAHSCCVLIASRSFFIEGKWHTLIDYEKFFELLEQGGSFRPEAYMGRETPEWATWGQGGFDPRDERVRRKGKNTIKDAAVEKGEI